VRRKKRNSSFDWLSDMARSNSKPASSLDALLIGLREGDEYAAREAAESLGQMGTAARPAVPDLIEALTSRFLFGMPQVELPATVALGRIGDARAIVPLISVLASKAPGSRREAVRALGAIGGPIAMQAVAVILRDEDRHVRALAANLLGFAAPNAKQVKTQRDAAVAEVDAQWRGKARTCPKCGQAFVAQFSRCKCAQCLTEFYASHLANPHEYPFSVPSTVQKNGCS
jgi:HEAT repeat protein